MLKSFDLSDLSALAFRHVHDVLWTDRRNIRGMTVEEDGQRLTIDVASLDSMAYVESLIASVRRTLRRVGQKILYESPAASPGDGDREIDRRLVESGDTYQLGEGLVAMRGDVLKVFRFFEAEFAALARRYGADENHYPVMLPMQVLEDVQYLAHFPQHVTFCTHLPEDLPVLEAVARSAMAAGGRIDGDAHTHLVEAGHALKPAVCLPCYPQHRGRVIPGGKPYAVTMQNHVFRFEGPRVGSLERLWDFSVRDIVFFGGYQDLARLREAVMAWAIAFCRELDLGARIELANDPFFVDCSREKTVYQRMGEVKYELLVDLPGKDHPLAVSSFNLHRDFYTSVYDIRLEGGARAETACMGFGLERWTYALLSQKGLGRRRWPERIVRVVEEAERHEDVAAPPQKAETDHAWNQ